jgi:putative oxidoreductase
MSFGESIAPLLGRMVLAWFYFVQAYRYAINWEVTAGLIREKGLPAPDAFLFVGLTGIVMAGTALLLGYRTRVAALVLFVITIWATLTLYDYWHENDPAIRVAELDIFVRNIAISGGLLAMSGLGGGPFSMDSRGGGGGKKKGGGGGGGGHH